MNLPRITFKRFLQSRWFPWSLVLILMTVVGGGGYAGRAVLEERRTLRQTVVRLNQTVESQKFEIAQAEWSLKQERNKAKATKKVREETRPDGTVIVEREETDETTESKTASEGTSSTVTREEVREDTELETTETEETEERIERSAAQWGIGLGVELWPGVPMEYGYYGSARRRLFGPFWLEGVIELDGQDYMPQKFGLGLSWEF